MKLLVSVRDLPEALAAAAAGADFIDLKEPHAGALGALPLEVIAGIVTALRAQHPRCRISATVGDFDADSLAPVVERAQATAACGVDYVKVGLHPGAHALLDALATMSAMSRSSMQRAAIVPVFIADQGLDAALIARAATAGFPALMLDTADKLRGSLLDVLPAEALASFVAQVRRAGALSGLAGALRVAHLPALAAMAPDFAGFRSAVCQGPRTGTLDPARITQLRRELQALTERVDA